MTKIKSNLLTYLAYFSYLVGLNLQFILLLCLGLGIFGIAPAIAAIIPMIHDFRSRREMKKFSTFFTYYKQSFIKSNLLFICFCLMTTIILLNIRICILYLPNLVILKAAYLVTLSILCLVFLFMLCNLVKNASLSWQENFRLSCFMLIRFPFNSLSLIFALSCIYFLVTIKSGIFLLLGFSSLLVILEFFHTSMIERVKKLTSKWG